jgi:hypothetical protein
VDYTRGHGLYSIGILKDSILKYQTAIKSDKFILVVHGSPDELARAKTTLKNLSYDVQVHSA